MVLRANVLIRFLAMHLRLAHITLCAWLLIGQQLTHAQKQTSANDSSNNSVSCPSVVPDEQPPSGPEISISDVTLSGFIQMPISYQAEIVASIKQQRHVYPLDGVVEEAVERVREGWQNRGYFKVEASGNAKTLTTSASSIQIALFVNVEENAQYRLGGISFKNNRALLDSANLRDLLPVKDGEIFGREKIAEGLENLRRIYGQHGYINYTGVPSTTFDDEKKLAYLEIDMDEGKQFYFSTVEILGVDVAAQQRILKDFPAGQIYNSRLFDLFVKRHSSVFPFPSNDPWHVKKRLNEREATVSITLDARLCPTD
jgi:outer membrane protein assembly factor BamA